MERLFVIYNGICIGGPMAGKYKSSDRPVIRIRIMKPVDYFDLDLWFILPNEAVHTDEVVYYWHSFGEMDVWAPEGWVQADIFKELIGAYEKYHDLSD